MSFSSLTHEEALALRAHIEQDEPTLKPGLHEEIESQIQEFLKRGGRITVVDKSATAMPTFFKFESFSIGKRMKAA